MVGSIEPEKGGGGDTELLKRRRRWREEGDGLKNVRMGGRWVGSGIFFFFFFSFFLYFLG